MKFLEFFRSPKAASFPQLTAKEKIKEIIFWAYEDRSRSIPFYKEISPNAIFEEAMHLVMRLGIGGDLNKNSTAIKIITEAFENIENKHISKENVARVYAVLPYHMN